MSQFQTLGYFPLTVYKCAESIATATLRKHAYSNILKISPPKTENFQRKNSDIFHVSPQNIDFGYSLEPPRLPTVYVFEQK